MASIEDFRSARCSSVSRSMAEPISPDSRAWRTSMSSMASSPLCRRDNRPRKVSPETRALKLLGATNMPKPWRISMTPRAWSTLRDSRTVFRPTPSSADSSLSVGSASPTSRPRSRMSSMILVWRAWDRICALNLAGGTAADATVTSSPLTAPGGGLSSSTSVQEMGRPSSYFDLGPGSPHHRPTSLPGATHRIDPILRQILHPLDISGPRWRYQTKPAWGAGSHGNQDSIGQRSHNSRRRTDRPSAAGFPFTGAGRVHRPAHGTASPAWNYGPLGYSALGHRDRGGLRLPAVPVGPG